MNNNEVYYYLKKLRDEYELRSNRNPRYSLKAFANFLKINPSSLSLIMAGKRSISTKLVNRIFINLKLNEADKRLFLESVLNEKGDRGLKRVSPVLKTKLKKSRSNKASLTALKVGADDFEQIADWYHYAILELTELPSFESSIAWIAKNLKLSSKETELAISRLIRQGLLTHENGIYTRTSFCIDTQDKEKTSEFHRRRQKQILEKSIRSLETDPLESRNHSGVTFCVNPEQIDEAKARIQKFMWDMAQFLMQGTTQRVYELNVSLFPLQVLQTDDPVISNPREESVCSAI